MSVVLVWMFCGQFEFHTHSTIALFTCDEQRDTCTCTCMFKMCIPPFLGSV